MALEYHCPGCKTALGYEGLCWRCKAEQERKRVLEWTEKQVENKQKNLAENIQGISNYKSPEWTDFWNLLRYRNAITPAIQRAALAAGVFEPAELYYHAPKDVRDGLMNALLNTDNCNAEDELMKCLAMQGDDKVLDTFYEMEKKYQTGQSGEHINPMLYVHWGGWSFDKDGRRIPLTYDVCYPIVKGRKGEKSPVRIAQVRQDTCPHCGGKMADMLVLDGRDERLGFLNMDGIFTAVCCPDCVKFLDDAAFNRFTLDGGVEVLPSKLFNGSEKRECSIGPEDYQALAENQFILADKPVPLFYGSGIDVNNDENTLGGFGNWVQDCSYTSCPDCGKPMKYLAQIQWETLWDGSEGTLYIEVCPDCRIVSMQHQET